MSTPIALLKPRTVLCRFPWIAALALAAAVIPTIEASAQTRWRQVASVHVSARRQSPTFIANLTRGKDYLVRVEGHISYWSQNGVVDAVHIVKDHRNRGPVRIHPTIRFVNPNYTMLDLIGIMTKGGKPKYTPSGVYYAWFKGQGAMSAYVQDGPYSDNRGSLKVTIFEPIHAAVNRTYWRHSRGHFQKHGNAWREDSRGTIFSFVEVRRTSTYVMMYDGKRKVWVYLDATRCWVSNGGAWTHFYNGAWVR